MPVMWKASCKWWSIVKRVWGAVLAQFELSLESIDLSPEPDNVFLSFREVERRRDWCTKETSINFEDVRRTLLKGRLAEGRGEVA